jgi:hypothetical protein
VELDNGCADAPCGLDLPRVRVDEERHPAAGF